MLRSSLRRSSELCFELARRFSSLSRGVQDALDGLQNPPNAAGQLVKTVSEGSALVVTRDVEYAQLILGFEQCQHYSVRDQHGDVVALLAEEHGGLGTTIGRQLLRSRRSFKATILDPDGKTVLFKMRRPAYLMSSTMFIEDADDERIGEVQQEWRPLRRCYNLFLGNEQYARIDSPFLVRGGRILCDNTPHSYSKHSHTLTLSHSHNRPLTPPRRLPTRQAWEFVLRDAQGAPLALIDRNFSGFAKEIFSDAGRYCIHFGQAPDDSARFVQRSIEAHTNGDTSKEELRAPVVTSNNAVIPFSSGEQLVVKEPLDFDERLIALAAVRFENSSLPLSPSLSLTHSLSHSLTLSLTHSLTHSLSRIRQSA